MADESSPAQEASDAGDASERSTRPKRPAFFEKEIGLMLGTTLYGLRDVHREEVPSRTSIRSTPSTGCRTSAGWDLWPYGGVNDVTSRMAMGYEYCGIVVEIGNAVTSVKPGQFVVGSSWLSGNTRPHCRFGFQSSCEKRELMTGAQAPLARVPLADGNRSQPPNCPRTT